jgi:hypothetical protein
MSYIIWTKYIADHSDLGETSDFGPLPVASTAMASECSRAFLLRSATLDVRCSVPGRASGVQCGLETQQLHMVRPETDKEL